MRTLCHPLHLGSLLPLFWLPLLPCCSPPPWLLCLPLSLLEGDIRTARTAWCTARAPRAHRARTALIFLPTLSCIFHIFSGWQGRGGLRGKHTTTEASTPSSSPMVVVAAHTPCQGRAVGRGRRGCRTLRYGRSTEEPSAPQGAQACGAVSNVSRFAVLNALVSRFGVLLLGVPKPRK